MNRLRADSLLLVASAFLLSAVLASCGSSTTTVVQTQALSSTTRASGPSGELSATSVGAAEQGATTDQVKGLFGEPDQMRQFEGCALSPQSTGTVQWIWNEQDGSLSINFDAADSAMASYKTTSAQFPTQAGIRVGDSFSSLSESSGAALKPLDLGEPSTPESGVWFIKDSAKAELLFDVRGAKITSISGGYLPVCE